MPISVTDYLSKGPATSKEIQAATGLSQPVVSRQLRAMEEKVVKLAGGRSPRYAVTRTAFGGSDRLPLSMIDAHGNSVLAAYIRPLAHGGFYVEPAMGMSRLLLGENNDGLYDDLPYFLYDLSPLGFLGRKIAEAMAVLSDDFPHDPRYWNTNHIGRYLVSNGDDLPGNFKFGEQALLRVRRKPVMVSDDQYPSLADNVMSGAVPGSSAGGEQPKFTAFSSIKSSHVIVKFSPKGNSEIAIRWRDILIAEYHAMKVIQANNFPVAETRLIEHDDRLFLESQRFDRSGEYGRKSMISLRSVDAEFIGMGSHWPMVLNALYEKELIHREDVHNAEMLWCFGQLIYNTDMHLGNLSLAIEGERFRLLPIYDMCPMGFAPRSGGDVFPYDFVPSGPRRFNLDEDSVYLSKVMAHNFWERVSGDGRISDEFKRYLDRGNPVEHLV